MGLFHNIPMVESAQALSTARAIAMAMGDAKSLAAAVYSVTENPRLASRIEVQAALRNGASHG